jgi:hypothetical protein
MSVSPTANVQPAFSAGMAFPASATAESPDGEFSFHDLVSIVNPLQHFPVVSTLYRKFTGDTIKPLERVAGDTLYGGWMGFVSSVANLVFEKATGKDFGDTVLALVDGDDSESNATAPQLAAADKAAAPVAIASAAITETTSSTAGSPVSQPPVDGASSNSDLMQRASYAYRRSLGVSLGMNDLVPAF